MRPQWRRHNGEQWQDTGVDKMGRAKKKDSDINPEIRYEQEQERSRYFYDDYEEDNKNKIEVLAFIIIKDNYHKTSKNGACKHRISFNNPKHFRFLVIKFKTLYILSKGQHNFNTYKNSVYKLAVLMYN